MRKPRRGLRTVLCLLALVLIGTSAARMAFAAEAASGAHGDNKGSAAHGEGKGSAPPTGESGDRPPPGNGGKDGAKGDVRPAHGDDNKDQNSSPSDHGETVKDASPSARPAKDFGSTEPYFQPSRRLDKRRNKAGEGNATAQPAKPNPSRRLSRVPQPPNPVRNAIGVPLPPHENAERRDSPHPLPGVPHTPGVAPIIPGNVAGRLGKTEGVNHPISNPAVTPPAANRGAINGTGVTRHSVGPPRIGGPTASVTGINGTTIRTKH
jgi:hypothetical protein